MPRPAQSYRAARKSQARAAKMPWRKLPRVVRAEDGTEVVVASEAAIKQARLK